MRWLIWTAVAIGILATSPTGALAQKRVALVVANASYKNATLDNPLVDADLVSEGLKKVGFDTLVVKDADLAQFDSALRDFGERARGADIALFYFAGHGFAVNDGVKPVSLLMSTSAEVTSPSERVLRAGGIPLNDIVEILGGQAKSTLIFVDACRNDPRVSRGIGAGRGFNRIDPIQGSNLFIGLSTRLGDVAADGVAGKGSPFARAFAADIRISGLRVDDFFRQVRDSVRSETAGRQVPDVLQDDLPQGALVLVSIGATGGPPVDAPLKLEPTAPTPLAAAPAPPVTPRPQVAAVVPAAPIVVQPSPPHSPQQTEAELELTDQERLAIEKALLKQSANPGSVDGIIDADTRDAIRSWQYNAGFKPSGFLDEAQVLKLIPRRGPQPEASEKIAAAVFQPLPDTDPRLAKAIQAFQGRPFTKVEADGHIYVALLTNPGGGGLRYFEAKDLAESSGGRLAVITSANLNKRIFDIIKDDPRFWWYNSSDGFASGPWIGYYQAPGAHSSNAGWTWVDGSKAKYTNWDRTTDQPNEVRLGNGVGAAGFGGGKTKAPVATWQDAIITKHTAPGLIIELP